MLSVLFEQPLIFVVWVLAFLLALSVHEFSHALVGFWLGDETAKRLGRLTLNPMAHIDPIGLAAVLLIGFGWGKPVPYNPYSLKWPKWGPVAVAVAGPMSNLIMGTVATALLAAFGSALGANNLLTIFLFISAQLNIALLAFNLIPLPPLDGSKVLLALLSHPKYAAARAFIESRGPSILFCIILLDSFLGLGLFNALFHFVIGIVTGIVGLPAFL